jgi:RNA polymerase sigma-70 factor (ECF subfamily)
MYWAGGRLFKSEEQKRMANPRRLQYLDDRELVRIARMNSLEACDELVRRYRGAVVMVASQIVGAGATAEDVAQEAFLLAFHALPQLSDPAKFPGWLYTITRHRAMREIKREKRSSPTEPCEIDCLRIAHEPTEPDLYERFAHSEQREEIRSGLDTLPEETRLVLHLYYIEEWTAPRIADFLSLPLTTIRWRLHSGLKQLRRRLSELFEENQDGQRSDTRSTPSPQVTGTHDGPCKPCRADR